ncbi:ammonia-forming cytochrome c nitrite reductase subunit c552 [Phycisphaerales bacterium AB-hyl4]|uniref:nitrite reductase (cytochrome; ammonia-forming) n=1 Tax=Natronomicrosphaera hydrolytica TaxID=3242702 RepID=A0ABV4U612_9BACT
MTASPENNTPSRSKRTLLLVGLIAIFAVGTFLAAALTTNIFHRKMEERNPYVIFIEVDEDTTDPAAWAINFPRQYESYMRTTDSERTRYGGSDAIPKQKLDSDPWLRMMWSGYAFAIDYREARGHAYMLSDQDHTRRVLERPQPGACLHCHSSVMPAYRHLGDGDVMEGFRQLSAMPWDEARNITDEHGEMLINHPASCVDCHDPDTMRLRVTRPAFKVGIAKYMEHERGIEDYDVNRDATRQEMRTFACAQCHVEYYFDPDDHNIVTYPWAKGLRVEQQEAYYDEIGFNDWTHQLTGGGMLKAQHPEFELYMQGSHARAGVSCSDCHMPYKREGAMKVSDHHVRSPLLNIAASCQTCHNVDEAELLDRVHTIQDRTRALQDRAGEALVALIETIVAAQTAGASQEDLADALALQRKSQWRIDWVYSENSMGFHAPQESARILAEALDYARQGEVAARRAAPNLVREPVTPPEIESATPDEYAPPGPYSHPRE